MKIKDVMKRYVAYGIAATAMLATACTVDGVDVAVSCELGLVQKEYEVSRVSDRIDVEVLSNMTYDIRLLNDADWVEFPATSQNDDGFRVNYTENLGIPRMAVLRLSIDKHNQADTLYIKQQGAEVPHLRMENTGVIVKGSEGATTKVAIDTNIGAEDITITRDYSEEAMAWIGDFELKKEGDATYLYFTTQANSSADYIRKTQCVLSYVDGWNNLLSLTISITQQTANDETGKTTSFAELRTKATTEGVVIDEDVIIEGYVVSNRASGNTGENDQMTTSAIDYSICEKSLYFESLDGEYGFMIEMQKADDNIFKQWERLSICLRGATLVKGLIVDAAKEPEHYMITGVKSSMVVSRQQCSKSDVPVKKMTISELTDEDIYTYVTLQDCAFPMRKGPLTPINEGYSNACGAHRIAKAAIVVGDKDGKSLYLYTNTTCPYRRDGKRLPYGSGELSGVIVHEKFTRFDWEDNASGDEDTYGYIGRYQIRHTCYEDIAMKSDAKDSFAEVLCEWAYITAADQKQHYATAGVKKENSIMSHSSAVRTAIKLVDDMSYLGPVGNNAEYPFGKNTTNKSGLGVILDDGTDWMSPSYTGVNSEYAADINKEEAGKGKVPKGCGSAWETWYNYNLNETGTPPRGFVFAFSTKGIVEGKHISAIFSMSNRLSSNSYGPRDWHIDYSLTDATGKVDEEWVQFGEFTVPDMINWSPTQYWQHAGYKPMMFELPDEVANKDNVYVRIHPCGNTMGTTVKYRESYSTLKDSYVCIPWTAMNYFAIRYNK